MQKVECRVQNSAFFIPPSTLKWSPWSDLHRRIRVYETRPVAAEAQGLRKIRRPNLWLLAKSDFEFRASDFKNGALTWICTTNLRLRRAACRISLHLESVMKCGFGIRKAKLAIAHSALCTPHSAFKWHPWPDSHRLGSVRKTDCSSGFAFTDWLGVTSCRLKVAG